MAEPVDCVRLFGAEVWSPLIEAGGRSTPGRRRYGGDFLVSA